MIQFNKRERTVSLLVNNDGWITVSEESWRIYNVRAVNEAMNNNIKILYKGKWAYILEHLAYLKDNEE